MAAPKKKPDAQAEQIRTVLERHYLSDHPRAKVDVYRYNAGSIRVRIIDPDFTGKPLTARDTHIWEILEESLAEETLSEINLLLLLTPPETKTSLMNQEFEEPTPTRL
jgi:hypothetical protein